MKNRPLIFLALVAGAAGVFALGVVSAPHIGAVPGRNAGQPPPVVTVALDLMDEVTRLRAEADRLGDSLGKRSGRIAALESEIADLRREGGSALAAREAELAAARQRIATLTEREAELQQAAQRTADLSAKAEGLRQARDRARRASVALAKHKTDLETALQSNAEMAAKMEGLRRARDEAGEASAAQARTIATLRRDLSETTARHDRRLQERDAEISTLRESIEKKEREIARLRQTIRETATRQPAGAASAPDPVAPAEQGVLDGAAAYRAADYAKAYEIWQPLAENGNIRAQFHIGALYFEGRGVTKDLDSARFWLGRAAARGSQPAQALLDRIDSEPRAVSR